MGRLPEWLKKNLGSFEVLHEMKRELRDLSLHTVCEEARCPNIGECWANRTATLMILGKTCTRHCGFCAVTAGKPVGLDPEEPNHVAEMVEKLRLRHVVITMVARDDLSDGGAGQLAQVIEAVRAVNPETRIEVLTSDFQGSRDSLATVIGARPDVFNHNLETVKRLTPRVRHRSTYQNSLKILREAKEIEPGLITKSGLMLGLGERSEEVEQALVDLRSVGCELLTIGQYLQPTSKNLPVVEFVHPTVFENWRERAEQLGFRQVASGPFVRSSYHAEKMIPVT